MSNLELAALSFCVTLLLGALGWLASWAWGHTHKRIDDAWIAIDGKAPNDELIRVRDTQKDIYEKLDAHDHDDRTRHAEVVQTVGRLEGKVDALLVRRREGNGT